MATAFEYDNTSERAPGAVMRLLAECAAMARVFDIALGLGGAP